VKLPIDEQLDAIRAALSRGHAVIEAPAGAGKTTRVPPALLDAIPGEIWVTEPRRMAARMAARRVATERGEPVGGLVGYQVRFEEKFGPRTRIRFVTDGVLLRRLGSDPELTGIGAVLFDEFHERHLPCDLALALVRELAERRELRVGVMSATLETGPVLDFLPGCAHVAVAGRVHPVTIEHIEATDRRPLELKVRAALRRLLAEQLQGDVLVFLPGAAEIRRARESVQEVAAAHQLEVVALHGDLSPEAQDRAVLPGPRRKLILSTNVAESSVTIEGVGAVIDSGLARVSTYSPWTGLPGTRIAAVSQASAQQRAGRAGRTGPGRCLRLFSRHQFLGRPAHTPPEIERADLAEASLLLRVLGREPHLFTWFQPPPAAALDAADALLTALGAVCDGRVTELGQRMWQLPVHPRLARLIVAGQESGIGTEAAAAAGLLSERDPRPRDALSARGEATYSGPSDVVDWVERWRSRRDLDGRALVAADQMVRRVIGPVRPPRAADDQDSEERLLRALLSAFPDRVARRRRPGAPELLLASGGAAEIDPASTVRHAAAELVVVVAAEERSGRTIARSLSAIEPEWLLDQYPDALADESEIRFDTEAERVEVVAELRYGKLVLEESRRPPRGEQELSRAAHLLAQRLIAKGSARLWGSDSTAALLGRLAFVRRAYPERGLPEVGEEAVASALAEICRGKVSFAELDRPEARVALEQALERPYQPLLARAAPERIELAGGKKAVVHYPLEKPPWIESRLQDFFGMRSTPKVAEGRVALTLHLLAPNQRAVQVTQDLLGFWERHYPLVKRELERRYPRHAWPEDPTVPQSGMRPRNPRGRGRL
jgi:ATP-dependent helicase HrpB